MLTKKITYKTFDGEEITETFYFNFTKSEIIEMQVKHPGGYSAYLQEMVDSKDISAIYAAFKVIVLDSYGEKSPDGKHFLKSKELSDRFEHSAAYDELMIELIGDSDAAASFIQGVMPVSDLDDTQKNELEERTRQLIESKKN